MRNVGIIVQMKMSRAIFVGIRNREQLITMTYSNANILFKPNLKRNTIMPKAIQTFSTSPPF